MDGLEIWPTSNVLILRVTVNENLMSRSKEVWGEGALKQRYLLQLMHQGEPEMTTVQQVKCHPNFGRLSAIKGLTQGPVYANQHVVHFLPNTVRSYSLKHIFKTPACLQGHQYFSVSSQRCLSGLMPPQPWAHAAADTTAGVLANENNKLPVSYSVGKSFHHRPVTEADILETQS